MDPPKIPQHNNIDMTDFDPNADLPDVRDGLTKRERIVLQCLHEAQKERGGRNVPTVMLYGRVVEHLDISPEEFQTLLTRLMRQPR